MKILFLKNNQISGFIKINLFNKITSRAFLETIEKTNKLSKIYNDNISRNKIEIINDFLRLKEIVRLYNNTSYDKKIDIDLEKDFSIQKLFDLHEHFEFLGERKRSNDQTLSDFMYDEIIKIGCEMNGLIHKLESSLYNSSWMQALFNDPDVFKIPLTDEIIKESSIGYEKDKLYVGYGETGKNMAHIYNMNEVSLLERKMVQPQRYILSEFFLPFNDIPLNYEDYKSWCIKNNALKNGYDFENPIWYGTWEVGSVVDKSFDDLSNFPIYDSIKVEL